MPRLGVLRTLLRELTTTERAPRRTEPDLVMDDPDKVAAYVRGGREDGTLAPVYLFNCAQVSEVIRPGDTVVDLGCGPANQLGMVARLHPGVDFIGLDLSDEMLSRAEQTVSDQGLSNVRLQRCDITDLEPFDDQSVDAVMSTVVLHHLPDLGALERTFAEVRRVLKPGGGLYLVDFARLKAERSIDEFAYQHASRQHELLTLDYLYSLRAAFQRRQFEQLTDRHLRDRARLYGTLGLSFMVAIKSACRAESSSALIAALREIYSSLRPAQLTDLNDLSTFFALGGLESRLLGRAMGGWRPWLLRRIRRS
ncbi:MAG: class I SAM-dependent methyltransferase [Deltaproteobacteria bacterium]|jgi:ubiquinone/menaquinone biosynthesis C-methylase UbiE|nr:class I SAM-dependent methyltransferase [Deltaproteobacteria bacterium]MBW2530550.1 class I SAM-dependent methyltransferase [Deltaproteobacteria bacterium]